MPITFDKERQRWRHQLHRTLAGKRVRINKILPAGWSRSQAQAYDDRETARLLARLGGIDQQQRDSASIARAVELYLTERAVHLKSERSIIEHMAAMYPYYEGKTFADLPAISREYADDCQRRIDDKTGTLSPLAPATVRNRIALLRAACRYAWKAHAMGDRDPAERLYLPTVRNARQVYIDRREVLRAARLIPRGDARAAVLVAFYSGMRLGEIMQAQVGDTGAGVSVFWLADTKNGEPRIVPVHSRVAVYARRRFPLQQRRAWVQRMFLRAVRALDLGDVHFHDLRHSTASALINAGEDLYTVGGVLGHADPRSTKRYAHLAIATLGRAIEKIGRQKITPTRPKKTA